MKELEKADPKERALSAIFISVTDNVLWEIAEEESVATTWKKLEDLTYEHTLYDRAKVCFHTRVSKDFWFEPINTTCYLVNKSPSTTIEFKTPFEIWFGLPANYSNLKIFGCPAYVYVRDDKLESRAKKCLFLGQREKVIAKIDCDVSDCIELEIESSLAQPSSSEAEEVQNINQDDNVDAPVQPPPYSIATGREESDQLTKEEHSKYSSMATRELLQETERQLEKTNADLAVTDLIHLENELQAALIQIRSRQTNLLLESVKGLHEKRMHAMLRANNAKTKSGRSNLASSLLKKRSIKGAKHPLVLGQFLVGWSTSCSAVDGAAPFLIRGRGFDPGYGENSVGSAATLMGPAMRDSD
ncbi:putative agamous-like MADS-box protein AGL31-like [Capsicum annuum]|nr:putative agamous-like MADS-box protein AGL31-like [Capsicum annuum]